MLRSRMRNVLAGLSVSLLTLAVAPAASAGDVTIQATRVQVNVSCAPSGGYSWNATITDGRPNAQYGVMAMITTYGSNGEWSGGGGDFDFKYVGSLVTGTYGIGTSSTYTSRASAGREKVIVKVKIGGVQGSGSDTC